MATIEVRLTDGRTESITIPGGMEPQAELDHFLNRTAGYHNDWIKLRSGEHVRYDQIVSVRIGT